jgi:hypothetical protein
MSVSLSVDLQSTISEKFTRGGGQSATPINRGRATNVGIWELPMAGLEPARAFYGPTDFKSVASTIPPHRRRVSRSLSNSVADENEFHSDRGFFGIKTSK